MATDTRTRPSESGACGDSALGSNQTMAALRVAAGAFEGAVEEAGISSDGELAELVRKARAETWAERRLSSSG